MLENLEVVWFCRATVMALTYILAAPFGSIPLNLPRCMRKEDNEGQLGSCRSRQLYDKFRVPLYVGSSRIYQNRCVFVTDPIQVWFTDALSNTARKQIAFRWPTLCHDRIFTLLCSAPLSSAMLYSALLCSAPLRSALLCAD